MEKEDILKLKNNIMDTSFIYSNRFWVMVIGAVAVYLKAKGLIGEPEMALIATISAGFIVVRTVDRLGEQVSK